MLDEQFFLNGTFRPYLDDNFVVIHAYHADELAHDEKPRDELFEAYDVHVRPTILVADANGAEIDRLVGYDPPPEEFKARLEKQYQGENTMLKLTEAHRNDPGNVETLARMARKFQENYQFAKMAEYGAKVLAHSEEAKKTTLIYDEGEEITAYEYAHMTSIYTDPLNVIALVDEFPESSLKETAFYYLSRLARNPDHHASVSKAYEELFKRYPEEPSLLRPYIIQNARSETNVDRAIELAEVLYSKDPEIDDRRLAQSYAGLLLLKGRDKKAVKVYGKEYVKRYITDGNAGALNGYAWFWAKQDKNLESALAAVEKSVELKNAADTWDTLSMVLWKMGKHEKAIEAEEEALRLAGGQHKEYEERITQIKEDMKDK